MTATAPWQVLILYLVWAVGLTLVWWWWLHPTDLARKEPTQQKQKTSHGQPSRAVHPTQAHARWVDELVVAVRKPLQTLLQLQAHTQRLPHLTAETRLYLQHTHDALMHAQTLVTDLLDPLHGANDEAHAEALTLRVTWAPCEVRAVVQQAFDWFVLRCERLGLRYQCHVDERVPITLITDAQRLTQVLLNLLSNAVKFTQQGSIHLSVRADPHYITFELADTGPGIALHAQGLIFERYAQAHPQDAAREGGKGLGLAIARQLVTQLGGQLGVVSVLGQGSRFWFTLPRHPDLGSGLSSDGKSFPDS